MYYEGEKYIMRKVSDGFTTYDKLIILTLFEEGPLGTWDLAKGIYRKMGEENLYPKKEWGEPNPLARTSIYQRIYSQLIRRRGGRLRILEQRKIIDYDWKIKTWYLTLHGIMLAMKLYPDAEINEKYYEMSFGFAWAYIPVMMDIAQFYSMTFPPSIESVDRRISNKYLFSLMRILVQGSEGDEYIYGYRDIIVDIQAGAVKHYMKSSFLHSDAEVNEKLKRIYDDMAKKHREVYLSWIEVIKRVLENTRVYIEDILTMIKTADEELKS